MARRKKPDNETPEQARVRSMLEIVSNQAPRSDKTSWNRKMTNMQKLLDQIQPIEQRILELHMKKQPIADEIEELRRIMVTECVHPFDLLVFKEDHIECKFCHNKISLPAVDVDPTYSALDDHLDKA